MNSIDALFPSTDNMGRGDNLRIRFIERSIILQPRKTCQVLLFGAKFRQKFELELLYLHKTAPLVRKKMINLFMKVSDLKFRFEVYLIVVL